MSNSKPMRVRAMTVAGGIALLGVTGAGMSATANAASSASTTLAKIKYCESGGNYQAVNSSSGASGAYQFLNSTWRGLSASSGYSTAASAPAAVQDAAALELYNQSGTSPWAASSSCWSKLTSAPSTSSSSTTKATTSTATKPVATKTAQTSLKAATHAAPSKSTASATPVKQGPSGKPALPKQGPLKSHPKGAPQTHAPYVGPHGKAHAPLLRIHESGKHKGPHVHLPMKGMNTLPKAA